MSAKTTTAPELREPQLRILKALAKSPKPLSRGQIATKAKVDRAWLTEYIGAVDTGTRRANDMKFPSLLTLGNVKTIEGDGPAFYEITSAGRKAGEGGPPSGVRHSVLPRSA
jgi:hypothetical protein